MQKSHIAALETVSCGEAGHHAAEDRQAASEIDRRIRTEVGEEAFDAGRRLLDALASPEHQRMSEYLNGLIRYL